MGATKVQRPYNINMMFTVKKTLVNGHVKTSDHCTVPIIENKYYESLRF